MDYQENQSGHRKNRRNNILAGIVALVFLTVVVWVATFPRTVHMCIGPLGPVDRDGENWIFYRECYADTDTSKDPISTEWIRIPDHRTGIGQRTDTAELDAYCHEYRTSAFDDDNAVGRTSETIVSAPPMVGVEQNSLGSILEMVPLQVLAQADVWNARPIKYYMIAVGESDCGWLPANAVELLDIVPTIQFEVIPTATP
jgi:hypothetical protein